MRKYVRLEIRPCIEKPGANGVHITSGPGIANTDAHFFGVYYIDDGGFTDRVIYFATRADAERHVARIVRKSAAQATVRPSRSA